MLTPFALIVAGQIRMLHDARLISNWRSSVLEPLRPAVFLSVNTQWTRPAWNPNRPRGEDTSAADVDRIRQAFLPAYCAVANSTSPRWSWFWSWLDAYRGMAAHEIARGSRFKVVLHARPDLFFREAFSAGWFDGLLQTKVPFALLRWDNFGVMSRDLAEVRLRMVEAADYISVPSYCAKLRNGTRTRTFSGPNDRCNMQFLKVHQPIGAVVTNWPGVELGIQRSCQTAPSDKWKKPLGGVCINRTSHLGKRKPFDVERAFEGRCTSTHACKNNISHDDGACAEAADAVLTQCKCRRHITTKVGEVCAERCCVRGGRRWDAVRHAGSHLWSWFHPKKHSKRRPG